MVDGRFRVTVHHDDASRALIVMADAQLPRRTTRDASDAADRGQLVPSLAAEHAQIVSRLSGDLERTLANVDGVLDARVHLSLPMRDALRDVPLAKPTASVVIEHRGAPPLALDAVQRIIAGSAAGLSPVDVTVVFIPRTTRLVSDTLNVTHVGPLKVARGSVTMVRVAIGGLVVAVVMLVVIAVALYVKLARLQRERIARGAP